MKVLITGGKGLLAHWLRKLAPSHLQLVLWDLEEVDLTQHDATEKMLDDLKPDLVINTAAYNLVDRSEIERDLSWAVNATTPENLARICARLGCPLVHYSSDYVFDGAKHSPYVETDPPNPLNHYGAGKRYGEAAVLDKSDKNLVLRTSWLFGLHPTQTKSYVHSVLRQAGGGAPVKATTDQVAAPTYAPDLAQWTLDLLQGGASGLFHAVNDEPLSRYDWTLAILDAAQNAGAITNKVPVEPVLTAAFGSTMKRPMYSVLDNHKAAARLGHPLGSWRHGLDNMLRSTTQCG
jgi:dTDP-4-dehydrorhamnose reductase